MISATESQVTPINQSRFSIKVDHKIGNNDQLNGVYLFEERDFSCNFCGSDTTFGVPENNPNRAQTAGITWTHTFSPTILNQAKIGYVRRHSQLLRSWHRRHSLQFCSTRSTAWRIRSFHCNCHSSSPKTSSSIKTIFQSPRENTA